MTSVPDDGRPTIMTCQRCRDEASVHLTEPVDGRLTRRHLCLDCAEEAGVPLPPLDVALDTEGALRNLVEANAGEIVGEPARAMCPVCGLGYLEFRAEGRLGCPHDYDRFARRLAPLLLRTQGATRHRGKAPRRAPSTPGAFERLRLRARLRQAVAREDYEEAARLRDRLRRED